jgi:hypothetical protein
MKGLDITGPFNIARMIYHSPRLFWGYLWERPRDLWDIFRGRTYIHFHK